MAGSGSKYDWVIPAATAAVGAYGAYTANRNNRQDREQASAESDLDRRYRAAVEETGLNPFRHQLDQGRTLGTLDVMANAQLAPARYSMPGITVPQLSGGFAYQPSADLRTSAKRLQRDVASGRTAPTMTDPANYGQTGALNLNAAGGASTGAQPRTGGAAGARAPMAPGGAGGSLDVSSLLSGVQRRNEGAGGVMSGAGKGAAMGATAGSVVPGLGTAAGAIVGGIGGAVAGAFTKNAKTAATDVSVTDARTVIRDAYATFLGREPSAEEVESQLSAIGFDKGRHQWVGEQGLTAILRSLQQAGGRNVEGGMMGRDYAELFA